MMYIFTLEKVTQRSQTIYDKYSPSSPTWLFTGNIFQIEEFIKALYV